MAYIDETNAVYTLAVTQDQTFIRNYLNKLVWAFYRSNEQMVVAEFKFWIIKKTVRLSDLRSVFVRFVGEPVTT